MDIEDHPRTEQPGYDRSQNEEIRRIVHLDDLVAPARKSTVTLAAATTHEADVLARGPMTNACPYVSPK